MAWTDPAARLIRHPRGYPNPPCRALREAPSRVSKPLQQMRFRDVKRIGQNFLPSANTTPRRGDDA